MCAIDQAVLPKISFLRKSKVLMNANRSAVEIKNLTGDFVNA